MTDTKELVDLGTNAFRILPVKINGGRVLVRQEPQSAAESPLGDAEQALHAMADLIEAQAEVVEAARDAIRETSFSLRPSNNEPVVELQTSHAPGHRGLRDALAELDGADHD